MDISQDWGWLDHSGNRDEKLSRNILFMITAAILATLTLLSAAPAGEKNNLLDLIRKGDRAKAIAMINDDADIAVRNRYGDTPLHLATLKGHADIIRLLLQKGGEVNGLNIAMSTPLHLAASKGRAGAVRILMENGADPELRDRWGRTPLHLAAVNGKHDITRILLKLGARPDPRDRNGRTPLYAVARMSGIGKGHIHTAWLLLKKGAQVNAQPDGGPAWERGKTPLHWAVYHGHTGLVKMFVDNGADMNAGDARGVTPLHLAALRSEIECADMLAAKGAAVNTRDAEGDTPLILAVRTDFPLIGNRWGRLYGISRLKGRDNYYRALDPKMNRAALVSLLIKNGAQVTLAGRSGMTPLHWAAYNGFSDIARALIAGGAPVNARDGKGMTPLFLALREGHPDTARIMILKGADVNTVIPQPTDGEMKQEDQGEEMRTMTPLHWGAKHGYSEIVQLMLKRGALIDARDQNGMTPLCRAVLAKRPVVSMLLLNSGADVNLADDQGNTPLHLAAGKGDLETARSLIKKGSALTKKNLEGKSPRDLASGRAMKKLLDDALKNGMSKKPKK